MKRWRRIISKAFAMARAERSYKKNFQGLGPRNDKGGKSELKL